MLQKTELFWRYSTREIITMKFEDIKECISECAPDMSREDIVVELTKRKRAATSVAEQLACNRIVSAFLGGPDVIDY